MHFDEQHILYSLLKLSFYMSQTSKSSTIKKYSNMSINVKSLSKKCRDLCYSKYKNIIQNQENHMSRKPQTVTQHYYCNYITCCINFVLALQRNHQEGCLQNYLLM